MKYSFFFSIRIDGKRIFSVWSTKPTYWLLLSSAALVFLRALWLFWAFSLTQSLFFSRNLILHIITCFSNSFKSGQSWRFVFSWTISPWMEPAALLSCFACDSVHCRYFYLCDSIHTGLKEQWTTICKFVTPVAYTDHIILEIRILEQHLTFRESISQSS